MYDAETERIVQRDNSYVPGLYKIFDEILVNAADNKQRDSKMNLMKISINKFDFDVLLIFINFHLKFATQS